MKLSLIFVLLFLTCKGQRNDSIEASPPRFNIVQSIVSDNSNLFSTTQKDRLAQRLKDFEARTTNQVVIITVDSITPYTDIQKYANDLSNAWGVGQKEKNNGLAIVVSDKLGKVSIATGLGTGKSLTDSICNHVIERTMIPQFKRGAYYEGISMGLDSLIFKWK